MKQPRPDTVECLRCVAWTIAVLVCALALWAVTSPARAEGERELAVDCDMKAEKPICKVGAAELAALIQNNNLGWEIAERAATELKALKEAGPKCGTLEVQPKPLPPLKHLKRT